MDTFNLGDNVHLIGSVDISGVIIGKEEKLGRSELLYEVVYWSDGTRKTLYVYAPEIELVSARDKTL